MWAFIVLTLYLEENRQIKKLDLQGGNPMAKKIYKLYLGKMKEAWHQMSEAEQKALLAKVDEVLEQVGAVSLITCDPSWSTEQWQFWGVEEFPDIEAVMKHSRLLDELNWERYVESMTVLGTKQ
jgi:hypothetical protein